MEHHEFLLPSVADYIRAFSEIRVTPNQCKLLLTHHSSPARVNSVMRLAKAVGFKSYKAVNRQYGLLGSKIAKALNMRLKGVKVGILVDFVDPHFAANEHFLWVLRTNVALALEELGWAPKVSGRLFPDLAIPYVSHPSGSCDGA